MTPMMWGSGLAAQRDQRDAAAAIEPNRRRRHAEAGRGVADHLADLPEAGRGVAAAHELGKDNPAARQADLAAVAVAAEIERKARSRGVVRHLARMHQGDP